MRLATAEIATLVNNSPASSCMFPMLKLVDTAHANVHRVDVIWPLIMPFLIEAAAHKVDTSLHPALTFILILFQNTAIRNFAVESLTAVIHNSLAHTTSNPLITLQESTKATSLTDDQPDVRQPADEPTRTLSSPSELEAQSEPPQDASDVHPQDPHPSHTQSSNKQPNTYSPQITTVQQQADNLKSYPPQSLDGRQLSIQELHVDAMQVKMLEALTELSKNNHNDVKDKTLNAVDTLLQSSGQTLNTGYELQSTLIMLQHTHTT